MANEPPRGTKLWWALFLDFQNVLKSFIGSNYLVMPFAFSQGGLVLGLVALFFIGLLTDRCCSQLVQCKRRVVEQLLNSTEAVSSPIAYRAGNQSSRSGSDDENELKTALLSAATSPMHDASLSSAGLPAGAVRVGGSDSDDNDETATAAATTVSRMTVSTREEEAREKEVAALSERISFAETARVAFGGSTAAEAVVEGALAFTQLGFCVEYFIFTCTALREFFPGVRPQALLASVPVAFLAPCALLPSVKSLAPISAVANVAILAGFVGCLVYEVNHMPASLSYQVRHVPLANWRRFPIFFSISMSCYEGIGTVLPVEASMHSPRSAYYGLLHAALAFTTAFLGSFGAIGLLCFYGQGGDDDDGNDGNGNDDDGNDDDAGGVEQIATENLPSHAGISAAVRGCLVVAILCTYPLQLFPVIQICERWAFGGPRDSPEEERRSRSTDPPDQPGGGDAPSKVHVVRVPKCIAVCGGMMGARVPAANGSWRRAASREVYDADDHPDAEAEAEAEGTLHWYSTVSIDACVAYGPYAGPNLPRAVALRGSLVLLTAIIAVSAAKSYGYIASVIGAVGATTLTFVMPSLMHLRLFHGAGDDEDAGAAAVAAGYSGRQDATKVRRARKNKMMPGSRGAIVAGATRRESEWEQKKTSMAVTTRATDVATIALGVASGIAGLAVTIQSWVKA